MTAQIVNTESARMQSDTVGWMGGLGTVISTLIKKNKRLSNPEPGFICC